MDLRRSCLCPHNTTPNQIMLLMTGWRERERGGRVNQGCTSCSAWKRFRQRFFALVIDRVQSSNREVASGGLPLICPITGPS